MHTKSIRLALVVVLLVVMVGCAAHVHTIGAGPQGWTTDQQRQWYVLWGLVPINTVDTSEMAGGISNYEIKTELSPLDCLINIFTTYVSVISRTVTVTK